MAAPATVAAGSTGGAMSGLSGVAIDPMQVASASNIVSRGISGGSALSGLNIASAAMNIAAIPFNTIDSMNAAKTSAKNAAASAEALSIERNNVLRVYDRESRQLAANQTVAYIMSGLDASSRTVQNTQQITATERAEDRQAIWNTYETNINNAKRAEKAAKKAERNALIGGVSQMAGAGAGIALAMFSDERLKCGLIAVGRARNGLTIYLGRYTPESGLDDGQLHLFLIAQEVQKIRPNAVKVADNGFLMVDYAAALL